MDKINFQGAKKVSLIFFGTLNEAEQRNMLPTFNLISEHEDESRASINRENTWISPDMRNHPIIGVTFGKGREVDIFSEYVKETKGRIFNAKTSYDLEELISPVRKELCRQAGQIGSLSDFHKFLIKQN